MKSTQHSTRHVAAIFSFLWTGERREGFIPKGVPPFPIFSVPFICFICAQLRVNPWDLSSSLLSTPSLVLLLSSSLGLPKSLATPPQISEPRGACLVPPLHTQGKALPKELEVSWHPLIGSCRVGVCESPGQAAKDAELGSNEGFQSPG